MSETRQPLISVVILNWNRPQDSIEAIRSVLKQDHTSFEVLVWDNASTDDSRTILKQEFDHEPRVRLIWSEYNYGVAGGRNRAFHEARGTLFFSLDSDATIESPHTLSRMVEVLNAEPDIGALSFEVVRPDGHLMWPFSRPTAKWRNRRFDTIRVDGCSFATRRDVFERIGGFAEHFSPYGAEDQYYAFQAIGAGYRVVYCPDIRVIHAFTPRARHGRQFAMHVRNMIRMPLELFPFPHHLLRATAQTLYLASEAREQREGLSYFRGLLSGWLGPWPLHRRAMTRVAWRHITDLVAEDKQAGCERESRPA